MKVLALILAVPSASLARPPPSVAMLAVKVLRLTVAVRGLVGEAAAIGSAELAVKVLLLT